MYKGVISIYRPLFIIGLFVCIVLAAFTKIQKITDGDNPVVEDWSSVMEAVIDDDTATYTCILPTEEIADKVVALYTKHMDIEAYIDDKSVYELKPDKDSVVRTTGHCWNFIVMRGDYEGSRLTIKLKSVYDSEAAANEILYGRQHAIINQIIKENIVSLTMALIIFICGLMLMMYTVLVEGNSRKENPIIHFAFFNLLLGVWMFTDSPVSAIFVERSVGNMFITHFSLMLMPIPMMLFLRNTYQDSDNKLWFIYCYIDCAVIILRLVLQLLFHKDIRQTLWMTHASIGLFVIVLLYLSVKEFVNNKITKQMRLNIICVFIILMTTLIDVIYYRFTGNTSSFGPVGFMLYTIIMGVEAMKKSNNTMKRVQEAEIYKKLAYTDELTGVFSRTAYRQDIDHLAKVDKKGNTVIEPTVIFMFDLNDLKKCNDTFGHDYGDKYIAMASEVINRTFGDDGRCYRIGGDEFCVVMPYVSQNDLDNKIARFKKRMQDKNKTPFVVPVTASFGYAIYNPVEDENLEDTRKRADELMYKDKQEYKKNR